jgi:hypothetical protein
VDSLSRVLGFVSNMWTCHYSAFYSVFRLTSPSDLNQGIYQPDKRG